MSVEAPPYNLQQIGTGTARFPSGVAIPTITDAAVDPYIKTKFPKEVQVECILFWPQAKGPYPAIVLLHEWWGQNSQIKDLGARLACEGYGVIIPNLYGRIGGMVTANAEVAAALMEKLSPTGVLQDINSCCEFLNTRDLYKRNIHGVVGFGMGASLALQFACQRKRLRACVAYYGKMVQPADTLKNLACPVLYHQALLDEWVTPNEVEELRAAGAAFSKQIDIRSYPGAPHAFCDDTRREAYREQAATEAWSATTTFLKRCFQGT